MATRIEQINSVVELFKSQDQNAVRESIFGREDEHIIDGEGNVFIRVGGRQLDFAEGGEIALPELKNYLTDLMATTKKKILTVKDWDAAVEVHPTMPKAKARYTGHDMLRNSKNDRRY